MKIKNKILIAFLLSVLIPYFTQAATSVTEVGFTVGLSGYCGDGVVDAGEECDDGNNINGDGCNNVCEVEEDIDGGGFLPGVFDQISIYDIYVRRDTYEVVINWQTNKEAYCELEWGATQDLLDGFIKNINKNKSHRAHLSALEPSSLYFYKIFCRDSWGHKKETVIKSFVTEDLDDIFPPPNARDFVAYQFEESIKLSWINPVVEDFEAIKIMRSEEFYPSSIYEGVSIYNGAAQNYLDEDVVLGKRYYYTLFAYDHVGNYSSGAIAQAMVESKEVKAEEIGRRVVLPEIEESDDLVKIGMHKLHFLVANETIEIRQKENHTNLLPGTILQLKISEEELPKRLKSIIFSISSAEYEIRNYLLRIDEESKNFVAEISSPLKPGRYNIHLSVIDYKKQKIVKAESVLIIEKFGQIKRAETEEEKGQEPVYMAEAVVYELKDNRIDKWNGKKYSQFNPMYSNAAGQYGFLVPNGDYLLEIEKDNFFTERSILIRVEDNIINADLSMIEIPMIDLKKMIIIFLVVIVIWGAGRAMFKKRENNKKIQESNKENLAPSYKGMTKN